jgi:hypothetical protein
MNLNEFAVEICRKEKGKINLSIGQVREVVKCFFEVLIEMGDIESQRFLNKYVAYYIRKKK